LPLIGIDVSKEWVDVALHEAAVKPQRFCQYGPMAARRFNTDLSAFFERLVQNGKNASSQSLRSCENS